MPRAQRQDKPASMKVQQHLLIRRIRTLPRLSNPQQSCLHPANAYILRSWLVAGAQLRFLLEPRLVSIARWRLCRLRLSRVDWVEDGADSGCLDLSRL